MRQSQCSDDPPAVQLVQASAFAYKYEVVPDPSVDALSKDFATNLTDRIHNAVANEIFTCDYSRDSVWTLQSYLHEADTSVRCQSVNIDQCVVMKASGRVMAYEAPPTGDGGRRSRHERQLQTAVADAFADQVIVFVEESMNSNNFALDGVVEDTTFAGEVDVATPMPVPATTPAPAPAPTAATATGSPEAEGPASSVDASQSKENNGGLATPYVATIAVGSALVVLMFLMTVSRRRRGKSDAASSARQVSYDDEYLRHADYNAELEVDHLDLDSQAQSRSSQPEPIFITTFIGGEEDLEADPFTSRSRSKRSSRGPLGSQDELERDGDGGIVGGPRGKINGHSPRSYALNDTVDL